MNCQIKFRLLHLTLLQKTRQKDLKQNGQAFKSLLNTAAIPAKIYFCTYILFY